MSADDLVAEACRQTGLDDFGSDSFREGLGIYCDSLGSEAELSEIGTMAVPAAVVASLSNRLRVVDWARRHPDVATEPIDAPLVVIGMFRAGTTFLSCLLDQDRGNRPLLLWESADSRSHDPRPARDRLVEATAHGLCTHVVTPSLLLHKFGWQPDVDVGGGQDGEAVLRGQRAKETIRAGPQRYGCNPF